MEGRARRRQGVIYRCVMTLVLVSVLSDINDVIASARNGHAVRNAVLNNVIERYTRMSTLNITNGKLKHSF